VGPRRCLPRRCLPRPDRQRASASEPNQRRLSCRGSAPCPGRVRTSPTGTGRRRVSCRRSAQPRDPEQVFRCAVRATRSRRRWAWPAAAVAEPRAPGRSRARADRAAAPRAEGEHPDRARAPARRRRFHAPAWSRARGERLRADRQGASTNPLPVEPPVGPGTRPPPSAVTWLAAGARHPRAGEASTGRAPSPAVETALEGAGVPPWAGVQAPEPRPPGVSSRHGHAPRSPSPPRARPPAGSPPPTPPSGCAAAGLRPRVVAEGRARGVRNTGPAEALRRTAASRSSVAPPDRGLSVPVSPRRPPPTRTPPCCSRCT